MTQRDPPFGKILVANRGEIALRIIRSAREMNIATVAVHSDADSESLHVKFADESVCIGPSAPTESYLNIPAIISAAEITAADAIHPGYGFLSENPTFAEICEACGFRFIGPSASCIRMMGNKVEARKEMKRCGVDPVPGSTDPLTSNEEARRIANEIGFPVIIKAAAGGGGRGMKIVESEGSLTTCLPMARQEAAASFGNDALYIERYIERPRHIEFQVAGDRAGNVICFGERECSVQRRYQKMLEEAPSPAMTPATRSEMTRRITEALQRLGYTTVGTMEFLMDSDELYFMEMNTRIQVEHPVTEMVTGIDLLRLQISLAAGDRLPFEQEDIEVKGHAIECRINAEDARSFAPSPGTITDYHVPGGCGVRVDSHVTTGTTVEPHYDSMLAKLIVHDRDRELAIRRMKSALKEMVVEGVQSNIPFHRQLMEHEGFLSGDYDTTIAEAIVKRLRAR